MAIKPLEATTGPNTQRTDQAWLLGMELMPHTAVRGDMSPNSDLLDTNIYASSPNSLYMYDQEKMDMQSSLGGNSMCSLVDVTSFNDEFELSTNYEVSQDICSLDLKEVPNESYTVPSGGGWGSKEQNNMCIKAGSISDECNPTLAELNLNFDLLEDIDSYINFEMRSNVPESQLPCTTETEDINQEQQEVSNKVCESTRPNGGNSHLRASSGSVYQNSYMPKTNIKQEPADDHDWLGRICQMSLTQLLMSPLPNGKGLGLGTTSVQPLSTISEIDKHDKHALQNLLTTVSNKSREPLQATVSKKRPVSDSSIDPCYKLSAPKRPASLTGLNNMDLKWEEIKKFLHADAPANSEASGSCTMLVSMKNERKRCVSDSSSSVVTLTSNEDEESDSDKDYDDFSDSDLDCGADIKFLSTTESLIGPKEKQHFWQYNVQSKGPKGTRVHFDMEEDPHVLHDFEDPVFDPVNSDNLSGIGVSIKHGGKARKGDGNDIVPSPKKLCQIGLQLQRISKQITDFVPVNELPSAARSKTRKEKNKLASRACRLKKKAQHEANKVKLNGLEMEHRKLLTVIRHICRYLHDRMNSKTVSSNQPSMTNTLQTLIKEHLGTMVAGNTAEYVNSVIHKVEAGDLTGGLLIRATRSYPKELHK